jgi:hypothetical protein
MQCMSLLRKTVMSGGSRSPVWLMVSALAATCLLAAACMSSSSPAPTGGEGEGCSCGPDGGITCEFLCNDGLLCNSSSLFFDGRVSSVGNFGTCQQPNSVPKGGGCGLEETGLCVAGLVCTLTGANDAPEWTCQPPNTPLQLGDSCPAGNGCAPGLVCVGLPDNPYCVAADAGADAASGSDGGTD